MIKAKRATKEPCTIASTYLPESLRARFREHWQGRTTESDAIRQLIERHVSGDDCPDCLRNDIHCEKHK